jgi:hypothetical protein
MTTGIARAPFLDTQSFVREEAEAPPVRPAPPPWSPFLSVYESAEGGPEVDAPLREAYVSVVNELYDEEFDESLFELLTRARSLHQDHLASGHTVADADRIVTQHFSQLMRESESMLDAMARELGSRDLVTIDREVDLFAERYAPTTPLEPEFEDFLGKLVKKIGRGVRAVAKTAAKGLAQVGFGPLMGRIKTIVRPLLTQVLLKAIGRLPGPLQPVARRLAQRLGLAPRPSAPAPIAPAMATPAAPPPSGAPEPPAPGADPGPDGAGSPVQAPAGEAVPELQLEFDELLAEALMAEEAFELELEQARAMSPSSREAAPVFTELDEARERFAHDLEHLKEGENPAPYVENFLPAVLPALRIATRIIGRPRVVGFLASLLGKLISNLVGPQHAPALSRAMVDAGLRLLSLELAEEQETRLAASGVTATVEETLTRVASLPDHVLDNQELLEGFALEAFERAAAANLPALFPEATYRRRPDLLEGGVDATWIMLPLRRPRYKRCSRTFNVKITPHMAEEVESFEDAPLSDYLQDRLGLSEGDDVEAEVHLFEVLPGGTAADIVRYETGTPGLGSADEATLSQLQPLTHEAAGVLLGKPGLGRQLRPGSDIRTLVPGQRVYHLAMGRRPVTAAAAGRRRVRRLAHVDMTLDTMRDQVRVSVFLSEVKAQRLAVRLRQQSHAGALAVGFHKLLARRLPPILHGRRPRRLRIVHPAVPPGGASATVLGRLPAIVPQVLIAKLQHWLVEAFSEFGKTQAQKFLSASEDPADGVTLVFTVDQPPGLKAIGALLAGKGSPADVAGSLATGARPPIRVDAFPGYRRD